MWIVPGGTSWHGAVDNDDGDSWVLGTGLSVGGNNVLRVTTAGVVRLPLGNLEVKRSASGANVLVDVENESNTASSGAFIRVLVAGTSAGDPAVQMSVGGGSTWAFGIDNSDSDTFKVCASGGLGTNDFLTITTGGTVTINGGVAITSTTVTISAGSIITDTSTGLKIGTATTQKLGLWNTAPVVQPAAIADLGAFTGGVVGFLDAAERDGVRSKLNDILAKLRLPGFIAT